MPWTFSTLALFFAIFLSPICSQMMWVALEIWLHPHIVVLGFQFVYSHYYGYLSPFGKVWFENWYTALTIIRIILWYTFNIGESDVSGFDVRDLVRSSVSSWVSLPGLSLSSGVATLHFAHVSHIYSCNRNLQIKEGSQQCEG